MKAKTLIICIFFSALLLLSACSSTADEDAVPEATLPQQSETPTNQEATDNGSDVIDSNITQRWSFDEFRQNEEDVLFFSPTTDDYMLTEVYLLAQPDTGIIYTLTILRSFDESGNVVSQFQKYSFDVPRDAEYAYRVFEQDGNNYPSLVCVGYSVILEQTADITAGQRTKEQFINDYQADSTKYWLSMP